MVYKENFQDFDNAIESFENLLSRYDTTFYRLPAYYQLYRLYLQKENQSGKEFFSFDTKSSSFYYKDLILYEYPESEFALLINNPAAIKEKSESNEEALKAYREAYGTYTSDSLDLAMGMVNKALKEFGENRITPKFYFLKARIHAEQKSISEFESALEFLSKQYAQTEEGKEAKRLLALLQKSLAERAKESEATKDGETSAGSKTENNATSPTETVFVEEPSARHFYIVHVPEESVNSNRAKVEVSNFNGRYFANKRLDISMTYLSNDKPILIVKGLKDKEEAITYHKAFIKDETELRVISRKELTSFGISEGNFKTLFVNKQLDDYVAFFEKNYGN
ncbi:MAG: tetratricopeptide repeat protein [Luteibaculum sp.]